MNRRLLNLAQLADAESVTGSGFEFAPEHDLVNAGTPPPPAVELTPVGPPATVFEFAPEHDSVAERRAAFLAKLASWTTSPDPLATPKPVDVWDFRDWVDVVKNPTVWDELAAFLTRNGDVLPESTGNLLLRLGGAPLACFWLVVDSTKLRRTATQWLRDNWRQEWDRLTDKAKRSLMEDFAQQVAFAEMLSSRRSTRFEY